MRKDFNVTFEDDDDHHHHDDDARDGDDDNDDDDDTVMTWRVELTKQPMKRRMYCADTDGSAYLD